MDVMYKKVTETDFRLYSSEDILELSVKEITCPQTFDILGNATIGGLHDPSLGKWNLPEKIIPLYEY